MKFQTFKKKLRLSLTNFILLFILLLVVSCSMTIEAVDQPNSVSGGDILPVNLNVKIVTNQAQTSKFMVAVLVPKVWNARANTNITFTSSITSGEQPMTVIPVGTAAPQAGGLDWPGHLNNKIGNGGNLINDYEWIAFYSNAAYTVAGNTTVTVQVHIKTKVSDDNIAFKLGYVVANDNDGLSSPDRYGQFLATSCFRVNGSGDLIDFCNPQLSTVEPRTSADNDIVTLNFDAGVSPNLLSNASDIYLCATGITTTGERISVCAQNPQTKMKSLGLGRWRIDLWPRQFFSLNNNQALKNIEYYFTNASGGSKVGYGGGSDPFPYTFKCQ